MSKAVMYGIKSACAPNRKADEVRRAKVYKKNQDWTYNHHEVAQKALWRRELALIERQKEAARHE